MSERDLRRILARLIAVRVGISTLLLGSAVAVQFTSPGAFPVEPLFLLIGLGLSGLIGRAFLERGIGVALIAPIIVAVVLGGICAATISGPVII